MLANYPPKRSYFSKLETSCKCGCGLNITPETLALANVIREEWGSPLIVSSGARCHKDNARVKGAKGSAHLEGIALDLYPSNGKLVEFHEWAKGRVEAWGVRMEAPEATPSWAHFDLRKVASGGHRVFSP